MKTVLWSLHSLEQILLREIEKSEVELCISEPDDVSIGEQPDRWVYMRKYFDTLLQKKC